MKKQYIIPETLAMQVVSTKCIAASQTLTGDRISDGGGSTNPVIGGAPRRIGAVRQIPTLELIP